MSAGDVSAALLTVARELEKAWRWLSEAELSATKGAQAWKSATSTTSNGTAEEAIRDALLARDRINEAAKSIVAAGQRIHEYVAVVDPGYAPTSDSPIQAPGGAKRSAGDGDSRAAIALSPHNRGSGRAPRTEPAIGEPLPDPEEGAGALTFSEHEEQQRRKNNFAQLLAIGTKRGGDTKDLLTGGAKFVEAAFKRPPTLASTSTPGSATVSAAKTLGAPDFITGIVLAGVISVVGVQRVARRFRRKGKTRGNTGPAR